MDCLRTERRVPSESDGLQIQPAAPHDVLVVSYHCGGTGWRVGGEILLPDELEIIEVLWLDQIYLRLYHPVQSGTRRGQHASQSFETCPSLGPYVTFPHIGRDGLGPDYIPCVV